MGLVLSDFAESKNLRLLSETSLDQASLFERITAGALRELLDYVTAASASTIHVDGGRTDAYVEDGSLLYPYKTIEGAVAAMSATRSHVLVQPGTYTPPASISLALSGGVIEGAGAGVIVDGAAAIAQVFDIDPAAAGATWDFTLRNLTIRTVDSQVGIQVDNATVAQTLTLTLEDVPIIDKSGTPGNAIDVDHTDATNAVALKVLGRGIFATTYDRAVNVAPGNAGDVIDIERCWLKGGLAVGAAAVAATFTLAHYAILHAGFSGGHASNVVVSIKGVTNDAGTWAIVDAGDDLGATLVLTIV